ncbi:unnamed protein product [Boreogadus saida]
MHLSGRHFTLQAKNGRRSKTPGLHSSVAADEAAARLTSAARSQRDSLPLRCPAPHPEGTGGDVGPLPLRLAPLRLAPLQLPKEKKKPTDKQTSGSARKEALKSPAPAPSSSAPTEPAEDSRRPLGNRVVRAGPPEQTADRRLLGDMVRRGAAVHTKPSPPSSSLRSPTPALAVPGQKPPGAAAPPETVRRRLRRPPPVEQGRSHDIAATGDPKSPPPAAPPPAAPVAPEAQRADRALRQAGRALGDAAKGDAQRRDPRPPGVGGGLEVSGQAVRRAPVADLQDLTTATRGPGRLRLWPRTTPLFWTRSGGPSASPGLKDEASPRRDKCARGPERKEDFAEGSGNKPDPQVVQRKSWPMG